MRSDGSQRERPYVNQLALRRTAASILSSRRIQTRRGIGGGGSSDMHQPADSACAPAEGAHIHLACLYLRSGSSCATIRTIWPRPIRDLTALLSHPPRYISPEVDARLSRLHPLVSFVGCPTSHRFNGDPCRDPTSRACVRACLRACVRACTHPYTGAHVA